MLRARTLLQDLFSSIADLRPKFSSSSDERTIEQLCSDLLACNDETSIQRTGSIILGKYEQLDEVGKERFFRFLNDEMDLDSEGIQTHVASYQKNRDAATLGQLLQSAEPRRQDLLRRLNQVQDDRLGGKHQGGATHVLVRMRADLLRLASKDKSLYIADLDFAHLFTSWFNRGFLRIEPISWHTPADILAKIIQYEAVHAINDWDDLRNRLQPDDRRCFAFFHPAIPNEPLVFVEVALCKGVPASIQEVLEVRADSLMNDDVDTAAFYSISNCQRGLNGISFGNALIKQVVTDLSKEIPSLKQFVTLSPLPGFAKWLTDNQDASTDALNAAIAEASTESLIGYEGALKSLAAQYLLEEKRPDGQPIDPVARFHLRNGASVHALHAGADISANGIKNSFGVMVNYAYELPYVAGRHEDYVREHKIVASKDVANLALKSGKVT